MYIEVEHNNLSVKENQSRTAEITQYDIFTGNHTQLNGAVIASTADAASNTFSTGTLGWDSIGNHAE
ncbi:hypothetical protein CUN67_29815 (plasmid) [Pantoea cypripedii]|uniref:Uncharacterized protein n=1 Tax=Pantoea cypripedii TaxID=55209 RepID=A0A6B9G6A7_PANCY|nr:hypothetical protein CUN67_29815 [Pantoea cypripedii]